jgi:hypothetical protein
MYAQTPEEQDGLIHKIGSSRAYTRLGNAAALAVPEATLIPRLLGRARRRSVVLIVAGSVAFVAAIAAVIFVWNSANEETARHATSRFGAALVHNDPKAAPPGAAEYERGVRAYFGTVTSARLIESHQRAVGHDPYTRSFFVAGLLLGTRRGPAVIEVEFDNESINSDRVSSVYELAPSSAPGLSAAQRKEIAAALKARGNHLADAATLAMSTPTASTPIATTTRSTAKRSIATTNKPAPVASGASSTVVSTETKQLRCVRAAHGDVAKLARCTQ